MRHQKRVLKVGAVVALLAAACPSALAQCAMCKAAVGNSVDSASAASGMNLAVLVLLIPPVVLFCAFIVVLYRYRKAPDERAAGDLAEASATARRAGLRGDDKSGRAPLKDDGDGPTKLAEAT